MLLYTVTVKRVTGLNEFLHGLWNVISVKSRSSVVTIGDLFFSYSVLVFVFHSDCLSVHVQRCVTNSSKCVAHHVDAYRNAWPLSASLATALRMPFVARYDPMRAPGVYAPAYRGPGPAGYRPWPRSSPPDAAPGQICSTIWNRDLWLKKRLRYGFAIDSEQFSQIKAPCAPVVISTSFSLLWTRI